MAELFSIFGRLKNNVTCFFYKKDFHKQHQAEIYSEIITVSGIKRSQNKKYSKYKNCWIKSITAAKFSHWWKALYTPPLSKDTPPFHPNPHPPTNFYKKILIPLLWFLENLNPSINKGVGSHSDGLWRF